MNIEAYRNEDYYFVTIRGIKTCLTRDQAEAVCRTLEQTLKMDEVRQLKEDLLKESIAFAEKEFKGQEWD